MKFSILLFGAVLLLAVACAAFVALHASRLECVRDRSPWLRALVAVAALLPVFAFLSVNTITAAVVLMHLTAGLVLCDLFALAVRHISGIQSSQTLKLICAYGLVAIYLCVGWANAHNVRTTFYSFETDKPLPRDRVRVALIGDAHLGLAISGADFARELEKLSALDVDLLCVAGDLVDDDSPREDLVQAARAFGAFDARYGVFFAFGNHDAGYYDRRDFGADELRTLLRESGVNVLEDTAVSIAPGLTVAGRRDRSADDRLSAEDVMKLCAPGDYVVMLDHQPNDYAAEAAAHADLVLSGHTHGGHIFPAGLGMKLFGWNDRIDGTETRGDTHFVVTSGISGWGVPFKTGTHSEIAVIDIVQGEGSH